MVKWAICGVAAMATLWAAEFPAGPARGALVLDGDGVASREVQAAFGKLAGGAGATIVIVPSAFPDKFLTPEWFEKMAQGSRTHFGVERVILLHARSRSRAGGRNICGRS